jgi:hypothetical protein
MYTKFLDMMNTQFGSSYTPQMSQTISNMATALYVAPVFVLWALIAWGWINSMRREDVTYQQ